jgi:hypothetical protein
MQMRVVEVLIPRFGPNPSRKNLAPADGKKAVGLVVVVRPNDMGKWLF